MADRITYVYGIVPAALALAEAPSGLDGSALELVREGDIAALVSRHEEAQYPTELVESSVGNVAWVGPRAVAHDAVLTWANDAGGVLPLPMFTFYRDSAALTSMLRERRDRFRRALERVGTADEYSVRLFRLDDVLSAQLATLSPRLAEIENAAQAASPGQRYLLERKAESERAGEIRRVAGEVARESFDSLRALALDAARDPIPQRESERGSAILNAFFLVERGSVDAFRRELTRLVTKHEPHGFRFEFTGPWPPYHFVGEAG